jgi:hypothetical protein
LSAGHFSYGNLVRDVAQAAASLRQLYARAAGPGQRIDGQRVAFLLGSSYDYAGAACHRLA